MFSKNFSKAEKLEFIAKRREAVLTKIEEYFSKEGGVEKILDSYPNCLQEIQNLLIAAFYEYNKFADSTCFFMFLKANSNGDLKSKYSFRLGDDVESIEKTWNCPIAPILD